MDIEENLSRDIVRRIREGSASLGVLWDATKLEGLQQLPYRTDHLAVVVDASHPLAKRMCCLFHETLAYEHVGVQASSAVSVMLARAAALVGRTVNYRTQVSNFEASMRVVRARLGITVIPQEIASSFAEVMGLKVIPLQDAWAKRRFAICYRDREGMSKAAVMLLDFLAEAGRGAQ